VVTSPAVVEWHVTSYIRTSRQRRFARAPPPSFWYSCAVFSMRPEIIWYGERGIINALISHLRRAAVPSVGRLLDAVCWAGGTSPQWLKTTDSVNIIVEINLADFGVPDLILVCRTTSATTYVVFVEAKASTCEFSTRPNMPTPGLVRWGMRARLRAGRSSSKCPAWQDPRRLLNTRDKAGVIRESLDQLPSGRILAH
jgi:hypothetical protein